MLIEEAEPTTRETLETMSTKANLDVVAQIKSSLLEMPELGDDNMSFRNRRSVTSLRKSTVEA